MFKHIIKCSNSNQSQQQPFNISMNNVKDKMMGVINNAIDTRYRKYKIKT